MYQFNIKNNKLYIGNKCAEELIKEFGSPLFVYEKEKIIHQYNNFSKLISYPKKRIHYAVKANTNIQILKLLKDLGSYIDAVSTEEIIICLKAGFEPDKIIYTGINFTDKEFQFAYENNILINLGSLNSLERYGQNYPNSKISIRINPDIKAGHHDHCVTGGSASKFGIFYSPHKGHNDLDHAIEIIKKYNLNLIGIHSHIGSGILEEHKYIELMKVILGIAKNIPNLEFIDFGGGFGVPYRPEQNEFDFEKFNDELSKLINDFNKEYGKEVVIAFEPGRYIIAESCVLLTTITDIKKTPQYTFVGVDSGFNHLIRPMAYGSYHHVINASNVEDEKVNAVVAGYLCESGDVFTRNESGHEPRKISKPSIGDVLAILTAGAYGFSMSSNYNSRVRPAEVMVDNDNAYLIRRRETIDDILRTQII